MGIATHQILNELAKLFHIVVQVGLDLQDLFIQRVVAVAPVTSADFLNRQAQVVIGNDLLVNSNSFHQG